MSRLFFLLLSFIVSGCATQPTRSPTPSTEIPLEQVYYWRLEKDGKVSVLLGTVHQGVSKSELPQQLFNDMKRAATYVAEDDYSKDVSGLGRRKPYEPEISQRLGAETFEKFLAMLGRQKSRGDKIPVNEMSPLGAFTSLQLQTSIADKRNEKVRFEGAIDDELQAFAKAIGIPQSYLEDAKTSALCDDKAYLQAIVSTLSRPIESSPSTAALLKAYKTGNTDSLVSMMGKTYEGMPLLRSCLFTDREKLWAPEIESLHRAGPLFIVVGVGHMVYGDLPKLLVERGFTIRRIQPGQ